MRAHHHLRRATSVLAAALFICVAHAQNSAAVPAGASEPVPAVAKLPAALAPQLTPKQAREAEDAYLAGARAVSRGDYTTAEERLDRAHQLAPYNRDYALALIVVRQHRVTELVQAAAKQHLLGNEPASTALLDQARTLDPTNPSVLAHFGADEPGPPIAGQKLTGDMLDAAFAGAPHLQPQPGRKSVHIRGDTASVTRDVYALWGIRTHTDTSVTGNAQVRLDLEDATFDDATRVANKLCRTFAVAVSSDEAIIAHDEKPQHDQLDPLLEETIYLPGFTQDELNDVAKVLRDLFDPRTVNASSNGTMLVRASEPTLRRMNVLLEDLTGVNTEVVFDMNFYEVDKQTVRNIGLTTPVSAGVVSTYGLAQQIVNQNQSTLNQILSTGLLNGVLTGNPIYDTVIEAEALIQYGGVTNSTFSNILGYFGFVNTGTKLNGSTLYIPLAGLSVSGGSTLNLSLSASDSRLIDSVRLRASNRQAASFKVGERYPVVTSTYSTGVSSSLASSLAGTKINGTSVASLLSQYSGSSATIPQVQFEDLGLNLKVTPQILRTGDVSITLDFKIESLGGQTIGSNPVLNNRALSSTITVPIGQTALLASELTRNELRSLDGLPGLSELPGFQGTDKDHDLSRSELLVTITPHLVRREPLHVTLRPFIVSGN